MARRIFDITKINLNDFLKAKTLMTKMSEIKIFDENTSLREVFNYLKFNNFDIGICKEKDESFGYLLFTDIFEESNNSIKHQIKPIDKNEKIGFNEGIDIVINRFNESRYLFVFDNDDFIGIITYADLNRRPIHVFCYIAISEFENMLREVTSKKYDNDLWLSKLSEKNQRDIGAVYISEKAKRVERSLLECSTITHLSEIVKKKGDFYQSLGYTCEKDVKKKMKKLIDWRNSIMHGRNLITGKDGGRELFEFIYELGEQMENVSDWLTKN